MPVEFKDYYKTLGVDRKASDDEIRKSFRKLARQYHPDVAKQKGAEEKFKEINEAYEVLGDPEKRKKYDSLGSDWQRSGFGSRRGAGQHQTWGGGEPFAEAFEFGGTGFSDFFEQVFGSMGGRRASGFQRQPFPGQFAERGQDVEADILVTLSEAMSGSVRKISVRRNAPCERCRGTGRMQGRACPSCGGDGIVEHLQTHQVRIPAGVREGQRLRIPGQGEPGIGGAKPGDLYLNVKFAAHPDFRVQGGDLFYDLDLAPWEAALGSNVSIPTLNGPVNIKVPAGTQTGQKLRIKGRGLPDREGSCGDLYAVARVQVPANMSERERALWQQLARESDFQPRSS